MQLKKDKPFGFQVPFSMPQWLQNTAIGILVRSWMAQGFFYMNGVERTIKVLFELLVFALLFFFLSFIVIQDWVRVLSAVVVAHSLNWLFNGHLFVVMSYLGYTVSRNKIDTYLDRLQRRVERSSCIREALVYGSFARGESSDSSDLDVRLVAEKGLRSAWKAALFTLVERTYALIKGIPLDVYLVCDVKELAKMNPDETPIVLVRKQ